MDHFLPEARAPKMVVATARTLSGSSFRALRGKGRLLMLYFGINLANGTTGGVKDVGGFPQEIYATQKACREDLTLSVAV